MDLGGVMGLIFSCGCNPVVVVENCAVWRWFRRHWLQTLVALALLFEL